MGTEADSCGDREDMGCVGESTEIVESGGACSRGSGVTTVLEYEGNML